MIGIIEFKEDEHQKNVQLLHKIKKYTCELLKNLYEDEHGERRYPMYENRRGSSRGRYNMRHDSDIYSHHEDDEEYYMDDNRYNY